MQFDRGQPLLAVILVSVIMVHFATNLSEIWSGHENNHVLCKKLVSCSRTADIIALFSDDLLARTHPPSDPHQVYIEHKPKLLCYEAVTSLYIGGRLRLS